MHVRVRADADEAHVLQRAHASLGKWCSRVTVQIEKDVAVPWLQPQR